MLNSAAMGMRLRDRVWRRLFDMARQKRTTSPEAPHSLRIDRMRSARLRDLGFEADRLGGTIDFAKGQHHRHF